MKAATKSYKSINTLRQYITLESTDYWHLQYPLNSSWKEYFWDMSEKAFQCKLKRDSNGITTYIGEDGNTYYSSIELIQYAMASFQAYRQTNDFHWKRECIKHTDHFLSLATSYKKSEYTILNSYPIQLYGIIGTWPTALGFGVALSLLVRLFETFEKEKYLVAAERLLENFFITIEDGGIRRDINLKTGKVITILEEYPAKELSGVLNGHISALWGLYDLGRHNALSKSLFETLSQQLANNLNLWDGKYWSLYDLGHLCGRRKNYASAHYHMLHIKQFYILYLITNRAEFAEFSERLIAQKFSITSKLRAFVTKVAFRLTT